MVREIITPEMVNLVSSCARPCYYRDGNEVSQEDVQSRWYRDDWKVTPFIRNPIVELPEADRLGVVWPVGPKSKDTGFNEFAPILDPDSDLYAVGMNGLLPNADTLIGVA